MVRFWKGISAIALAAIAALTLYGTTKNGTLTSAQACALPCPPVAVAATPAPLPIPPAELSILVREQHAAPQTVLVQVNNERPFVEEPLPTPQNYGSTGGQGPVPLLDMPPRPTPFSIVWLSDTQMMSYQRYPGRMAEMGQWIADEQEEKNILYVVQTGDAVENGFSDWQWEEFDTLYNEFRGRIPFLAVAGNHDVGIQQKSYEAFLQREYVAGIPPEQAYDNGRAAYATFTAGGIKFIILGAGWFAEIEATPWMNEVLQRYSDHVAILLFHGYIAENGRYTIVGKNMFENVVKPNPNVRLVLCGHVCGTGFRAEDIDDTGDGIPDRRVNAMLYNYQDFELESGQLRLLTFDPATHGLTVMTYSPPLRRYFRDYVFASANFTIDGAF